MEAYFSHDFRCNDLYWQEGFLSGDQANFWDILTQLKLSWPLELILHYNHSSNRECMTIVRFTGKCKKHK